MKTMFGMNFHQLHALSTKELNKLVAEFTVAQLAGTIPAEITEGDKFRERYIASFQKHAPEYFDTLMPEANYADMRKLYDTEERFNLSVDMIDRMGNIGNAIQPIIIKVMEDMDAEDTAQERHLKLV